MNYKQNLHIHTRYCDGQNTPEEMAEAAIAQSFDSIGFSIHSHLPDSHWSAASEAVVDTYYHHIQRLKEEYAGRIKIFTGIEYDYCSQPDGHKWDYRIGSVHYFLLNGQRVCFDTSKEKVGKLIDAWFDGDGMAYAKAYYEHVARLPEKGDFQILGHTDIITKYAEQITYFDETSPQYRKYVCDALDALEGKIPFFEVNSGAIARGYRTTPYPAPIILDELKKRNFGAVITSDCHICEKMSCHYPQSAKLLWDHGFREIWVLTEEGFVAKSL